MENLIRLSSEELIDLKIAVEAELSARGVAFTVGQIGERIAISHFNATPGLSNLIAAPIGAKNVDALSRGGDRYSIKSIQKAKKTGTIYPDRNEPNKQLFEYLLLVCLKPDYTLKSMYRYSWSQFILARAWDKRMNAWYVPISAGRLDLAECITPQTPNTKNI